MLGSKAFVKERLPTLLDNTALRMTDGRGRRCALRDLGFQRRSNKNGELLTVIAAPEATLDDDQQFFRVDRLIEVIARAGIHCLHVVVHLAIPGQHDEGDLNLFGAQLLEEYKPVVAIRDAHVTDDQVKGRLAKKRASLIEAGGAIDLESFSRQDDLEDFGKEAVVIHNQDAASRLGGLSTRRALVRCKQWSHL
jgi:hypothetical protein